MPLYNRPSSGVLGRGIVIPVTPTFPEEGLIFCCSLSKRDCILNHVILVLTTMER